MSAPQRALSTSSEDNQRKRVCKACDRCRLKKSKCDGSTPCSRCKADNAICVFGERKKAHDKVYPKGYVEMLEQQQSQLVSGLREMYRRLQNGDSWPGPPLPNSHDGFPLTHDLLERMNILHSNGESSGAERFEDDLDALQDRCLQRNGPTSTKRRAASEESEPGLTSSGSSHGISSPAQSISCSDAFSQVPTPKTPCMDTDNYRSFDQKPAQHMMRPSINFATGPAALLQSNWNTQQLPTAQQMDVDMYSYSPPLGCDPQLFSSPTLFRAQDSIFAAWPDSFEQLIDPNALHIS